MNRAEKFVAKLCRRSFLSLWSYPNPRGKEKGKELCDCLVVCDPEVIILSVKDIRVRQSGDPSVDWKRWRDRAIDASIKQIYGAERILAQLDHVVSMAGTPCSVLPDPSLRRVHRVGVALGGEGKMPLSSRDYGKGYVHVLDETSFGIVAQELDTVSDFVTYLRAKEELQSKIILEGGGEEDLLACYLQNGRSFPKEYALIVLGEALWTTFSGSEQYKGKKTDDRASYLWDELIEEVSGDYRAGRLVTGQSYEAVEPALRLMAQEDRFSRRILAKAFVDFLKLNREGKTRSRVCCSPIGTVYVFLASPLGSDREGRRKELSLRCYVARGRFKDHQTVIGIATERQEGQKGHSLDILHFHKPVWTSEDEAAMEGIQGDLGYFKSPTQSKVHEDEYPPP